ncbi:hypothetical protein ACTFIY_012401 [Dictyostelium cf. discoideum]
MKSNLVIIFLILLFTFDFSKCNENFSCKYMKDGLFLAPTSIYSIQTDVKNVTNHIITRADIKNNSTTIQLFNFNLVNNENIFETLMNIINSETILINNFNKSNFENDISFISLNNNEIRKFNFSTEFQGKRIGIKDIYNPIINIINEKDDKECLENSVTNYQITGFLDMNKVIVIGDSEIIQFVNLNKTLQLNDTMIYFDKLFQDYYIVSLSNNEILRIGFSGNQSNSQLIKFTNNVIGVFNKTIFTSFYNTTSKQYSVFSNKLINEQSTLQPLSSELLLLFQLNFNISNIIPSENPAFILLYSASNEKLIIYDIKMNSTQQFDQFTLNFKNNSNQTTTTTTSFLIHSLIARGGSQIEPLSTTPDKTIKNEEKVVIPIIVIFIGILLVLGVAMTIKIILKKRNEKKNFIKLNESGLLVDENNINLDFPINTTDNQI